jgi:plasmid maintenance system antidote protein VapI
MMVGKFFDTTPNFWLNMQTSYDLAMAEVDTVPIQVCRLKSPVDEPVARRAAGGNRK